MNARNAVYWTATILTALSFLTGGAANLYRADEALRGMVSLGYPVYFVTIIGAWKVLGGLAILAPRLPRLKEWAYAGIAFDLTRATFSHVAMGHPPVKAVVPLVLLGIAAASWTLRPASRRLGAATGEPPAARTEAHEIAKAAS
ncbi:MAG: DoxX family protein [Gemmatimonadota bacterium]